MGYHLFSKLLKLKLSIIKMTKMIFFFFFLKSDRWPEITVTTLTHNVCNIRLLSEMSKCQITLAICRNSTFLQGKWHSNILIWSLMRIVVNIVFVLCSCVLFLFSLFVLFFFFFFFWFLCEWMRGNCWYFIFYFVEKEAIYTNILTLNWYIETLEKNRYHDPCQNIL